MGDDPLPGALYGTFVALWPCFVNPLPPAVPVV